MEPYMHCVMGNKYIYVEFQESFPDQKQKVLKQKLSLMGWQEKAWGALPLHSGH